MISIKNNFKKIIYFFIIGLLINIIPNTLNILKNKNYAKLELLEKKFLKEKQEKFCKKESNYSKFQEMGFEETAQKRFISCMKKYNFVEERLNF